MAVQFPRSAAAQEATPERIKTAIAEFERLAAQQIKAESVPGIAVVVVHNDKVVYLKGFGVRKVGASEAIDADTVFQLASVSKPITSTIVAALVGEKKVGWDDCIFEHDPAFEMYDAWVTRQVTLRDLLCHRSGIPGHGGDLLEDLGFDRSWILHQMRELKPASSFRSKFAYTNFGYSEAAFAAAMAVGKPWDVVATEKLIKPLGMKSTSTKFADFIAAKNRAFGHVQVDGKWVAKYSRDPDAQAPAGGFSSTVRDLAQWLRLQLAEGKIDGKQVIDAAALAETKRAQIVNRPHANPETDRSGFYGLGWNVEYDEHGRVRLGHSGGFALGAGTIVNLIPAEKLGIAVLCNASANGVPEALARSFCDVALEGKADRDWFPIFRQAMAANNTSNYGETIDFAKPPANAAAALSNSAYTGRYYNSYYGNVEIAEQKGQLVLRIGAKPLETNLKHFNRDIFFYQPFGEMAGGPSAVVFTVGPDGHASSVAIEILNADGQGVFMHSAEKK
ncbi:MAG TPA: serine hydrolase [Pirellulales bacterium]|jgi:CubicO group peptidase (beta-lactamase class C family)